MDIKERFSYILLIAFLMLGALVLVSGGLMILVRLRLSGVVLISSLLFLVGGLGCGYLGWRMILEYREKK